MLLYSCPLHPPAEFIINSDKTSWDVVQILLFPVFFYIYKAFLWYLGASLSHFTFKAKTRHILNSEIHVSVVKHKKKCFSPIIVLSIVFSKGSSFQKIPSLGTLLKGVTECIVGEWDCLTCIYLLMSLFPCTVTDSHLCRSSVCVGIPQPQ